MKTLCFSLLLWLQLVAMDTRGTVATDTVDQHTAYRGDKVLRVTSPTDGDFLNLMNLLRDELPIPDVDVWREPSERIRSTDIYAKHQDLSTVTAALQENGFTFHTFIEDVQSLVDNELDDHDNDDTSPHREKRNAVKGNLNIVNKFARHEEILEWQRQLEALYPHLVALFNIGNSYEGRLMQVIRVGKDVGRWKPAIFIDAAMHAREWIAPSTAVYIIEHLLTKYWVNATVRQYVDKIDWYFLLLANPDGYEYTHTHFRLWRKNRRPLPITPDNPYPCTGIDLNRNWGFNWGGENSSPNKCDIMYRGPTAMSEPEVQNIANFLLDRIDCMRVYISLHSYSQFWFTRWSFADVLPPDHTELLDLAKKAVDAVNRTHSYGYQAGRSPKLLYTFSGGSADWAKGVAGIKYSYLIELRDSGEYGFLLPKSQIIPTGEEIWAGMDVVAERILLRYPVSVPLEEETNQEEEVEGQREEGNMHITTTAATTTTTSQQHIEPHKEQQTSLPQTIQPPSGPPALHSTPSPRDRSPAPNSDDVIENGDNDDVIHTNNNVPDLSNNQIHRERSIGASAGSSSPSYSASQGQNVLLAEVVAYFITTLLMKIILIS